MDLSSVSFYLRWQRFCLGVFRIAQWLFVVGLELFLAVSKLLWVIPMLLAIHFRSMALAWIVNACVAIYDLFLFDKVIEPRTMGWFIGRACLCEDLFVKKVIRILKHCMERVPALNPVSLIGSPELGLKRDEIRLMKTTLLSKDILQEVMAN